jgi:hypothetical protein
MKERAMCEKPAIEAGYIAQTGAELVAGAGLIHAFGEVGAMTEVGCKAHVGKIAVPVFLPRAANEVP